MKTTADESEDAFSGETIPLDIIESEYVAKEVIANSRSRYGTSKKKVETYLKQLLTESEKNPNKPKVNTDNGYDERALDKTKSVGPKELHGA
jgi:hypothetical protein